MQWSANSASGLGLDAKFQQHRPLQRTSSQSSVSSLAAPHTGAQTPQLLRRVAALSLNQTGQVRCLQTLSQPPAGDQCSERDEDKHSDSTSALALALSDEYVFSGSQRGQIYVWNRETFRLERVLYGHTAGCLALVLDDVHGILFSGGGDGKVRAWDIHTLRCLYIVHAGMNSGAILSLAYSREQDVLVLGCQNTSIQVFDVANKDMVDREVRIKEIAARRSRFFDSPSDAVVPCTPHLSSEGRSVSPTDSADPASEPAADHYVVLEHSITRYAHSGYIYSLLLGSPQGSARSAGNGSSDDEILFSAASDGGIRLWRLSSAGVEEIRQLERTVAADGYGAKDEDVCIHSLELDDGLLFAGLQSGDIEVWDLETMQCIRTLAGGSTTNVLSLLVHEHCLYAGAADGTIHVWGADLQPLGWIAGGSDSVLALVDARDDGLLVSGTDDGAVAFWDVSALEALAGDAAVNAAGAAIMGLRISNKEADQEQPPTRPASGVDTQRRRLRGRHMLYALEQWIQFKSVSGVPELQSECRRAARFLKDVMRQLGAADSRLISSTPSSNPLVYGRFDASDEAANALPLAQRPTIFVYGHYDVMPAGDEALWRTQPFELVGRDGYLYGRGVSDDKGPVLATLFAISELAASGNLPMTVVFCIEGEEEHGSLGLHETMEEHRELFGIPRLILLSLSYWLGESTPCLTYGMRGSIRANMRVESTRKADVHAGVWGGAVNEPLTCLSHILARLADPSGRVLIPGFHDNVRPVSEKEEAAMHDLVHWITAKEARAPLVTRTVLSPMVTGTADPNVTAGTAATATVGQQTQSDLYNQLMQRWRFPTLTVHHMDVSTVAARTNTTLVPAAAQASLSLRVVPDQSLEDIADKLRDYIEGAFDEILAQRRQNSADGRTLLDELRLHLDVQPNAQWWLADPETPVYQAAAKAIRDEWSGTAEDDTSHVPLLIREGGSIPAVPWLESFFAPHAVAVNLPMGQSSDNAHLDNERISLENLMRGRRIIQRLVKDIAHVL
ncbi:hypothetical protein LPJ61_001455 [Coemansia biformis]|uniref:Peptidase M20 dimerisation domain-containing protein n=1 Tax=Coemansia biformis TaxID=1286918 RepID=A0A9W7Y9Z3_9FUNG|nr:hypothetical protein LPJ61_001455 [Coemansia biformis]